MGVPSRMAQTRVPEVFRHRIHWRGRRANPHFLPAADSEPGLRAGRFFLPARNEGAPALRTQRASSIARSARAPSDVSAYTPARGSINRMAARISQSRIGAEARRPGAGRWPPRATRRIDIWASVRRWCMSVVGRLTLP